jgi:hypothetical protein
MNYTRITRYDKCDILLHQNDIEYRGYDKNNTEGNMIDIAVINNCPIIIKNGKKGKWYLKGYGKSIEYLKSEINKQVGKSRDGVFCLLLE